MRAVAYRVRHLLRAEWRRVTVLTLVVGVVGGLVLTLATGAERTASAPDRYTAASGLRFDAEIRQQRGRPRTPEVAALPGVRSVQSVTFVFAALARAGREPVDVLVFAGSHRAMGTHLSAGREPDPTGPPQFVANRIFVERHHLTLGDRFDLYALTQEQADAEGFDALAEGFRQPLVQGAELVGMVGGASELLDPTPFVVFPGTLLEKGDVGVAGTTMSVRLRPGTDRGALRAQLDNLPGGAALSLDRFEVVPSEVRKAVDGESQALWLLALVGASAGVVSLGQLLLRQVRLSAEEGSCLEAVGFIRAQLWAESTARAAVPILLGTLLGAGLAVAFSPLFPRGFVRTLEPHAGVRVDPLLLASGAAGLVAALLVWTLVAVVVSRRPPRGERPAASVEWVAMHAPSQTLATGTRFAFTQTSHDRGSVRTAIAGLVAITAVLAGAIVFGSSLNRLVTQPTRFGANFDGLTGGGVESVPDDLRARLEADPDVGALTLYGVGQARTDNVTLGLAGMAPVRGGLTPVMLQGRAPSADDEIAPGRLAARKLGVKVGGYVRLEGEGPAQQFRVTGIAVVPGIDGLEGEGLGQDAVVTFGGLTRLDPAAQPVSVVFSLRKGAPSSALRRLGGHRSSPTPIVNLARIRGTPFLLAGLLGALAAMTLAHVMVTSVANRRRDIAVLRSLGADRRWVSRAVHWQATAISVVPILLGLPLGLIAGRLVFRAFAESVGAVPGASHPYLLLGAIVAATVTLANTLAAVPARWARRLAPAPLLTPE